MEIIQLDRKTLIQLAIQSKVVKASTSPFHLWKVLEIHMAGAGGGTGAHSGPGCMVVCANPLLLGNTLHLLEQAPPTRHFAPCLQGELAEAERGSFRLINTMQ
jgi:hypothetical protein